MAIAEHEIAQPEVFQYLTIRLTEAQAAKLREAAAESRQSVEEFIITVSVRAADALYEPLTQPAKRDPLDSIFGIFKDSPELDALMERIHEERRQGIEQFRAEESAERQGEANSDPIVIFTSYDGTAQEVSDLPANLGRATAHAALKSAGKVWGDAEEESACHDIRKEI